jgi:catechol 2,3-dioxygenase-like lactoylglutathione lyase family enzyme
MDWTLEVVQVPVADVDRAKAFYAERLGFAVDLDMSPAPGVRFVQLTPPGSGCSIQLSSGMHDMAPGTLRGLLLVVPDLRAAHAELRARGVETSDLVVFDGPGSAPRPPRDDDVLDFGMLRFSDPDGNGWAVQQISPAARRR